MDQSNNIDTVDPQEENVKVTLTIPKEMYAWLDKHKDINRSQLFRDAVTAIRHPFYRQLSDTVLINFAIMLVIILGFIILFFPYGLLLYPWLLSSSIIFIITMLILRRRNNGRNRRVQTGQN